jgi:5-methylcytosine-specific restriction endonuclease McrA|tara:strand:- start:8092 stop:8682 length:591 start_codon:yes stop_codon:yes gene_type:complete
MTKESKNCSICKKDLPLDQFYLNRDGSYNFCCTPCDKKRKAVYRAENKEKIAIQEHKYKNTERGYVMEVINGVFYRYRKKDARLKWKPECTRKEIYAELMLYIQDHGRHCEYCKEPWTYKRVFVDKNRSHNQRGPKIETNFSIDRLDSTKTYALDNLVFCCVGCNLRKNQVRLSDIVNILRVWMHRRVNGKEKNEF